MSAAPRNILIVNTHSVLNSGDAAIVLAQIEWLRMALPGVRIALTSRTPATDGPFYEALGVRVIPSIFDPPSLFAGLASKVLGSVASLLRVEAKTELFRAIRRADLVIGSGGGYFYSNRAAGPGPMFLQNILHLKLARLMKKPVVLFPQSFGPTFNPAAERLLRNMLEDVGVRHVLVREDHSRRFLESLLGNAFDESRFDFCPDMAFWLEPGREAENPGTWAAWPRPVTAVTVRNWDFPDCRTGGRKERMRWEYLAGLEETAVRIHRKWSGTILVFPQSRGPGLFENDRTASLRLFEAMKKKIPARNLAWVDFPDAVSPRAVLSFLSRADLLLATRFHSALLALIGGVPVLSLSYQPKSSGMMKTLGLERYSIDIAEAGPEVLWPLAEELMGRWGRLRPEIGARIGRMRETIGTALGESLRRSGVAPG